VERSSVPELVEKLEDQARQVTTRYVAKRQRAMAYRSGNVFVRGLAPGTAGMPEALPPGPVPEGRIRNKGVADLMVVEQKLLRYVPGEVAHIENVMQSESRGRNHRRLTRTEEETVTVTDRTEESLRDLQSTERFEMQRETQKTVELDASAKTGVTVTSGFGPVEMTAYADFAFQFSQSEANHTSTSYAKDVTERSVARIM
jgi:hypothetical protein